jgi:hypothetical protein
MNLAERAEALLALVERHRSDRCSLILQPADVESQALVRSALADGRRRVSTAIAEERKRMRGILGALEAALHTERRITAQRHVVSTLARALSALRAELHARWQDPALRERWIDAHLARACAAFVPGSWRVRHHGAWSADERSAIAARLAAQGIDVEFAEDLQIGAGFVVACGHNVLDASLDGLLADRAQIEGRLLQLLEEA